MVTQDDTPWTAAYVRDHVLQTDKTITGLFESSLAPSDPVAKQRYAGLQAYIAQSASKLPQGTAPRVVFDTERDSQDARALQSKEGHNYLTLSAGAIAQAISNDADMANLRQSIDREMGRIRDKAVSPAGVAAEHEALLFFKNVPGEKGRINLPLAGSPLSDAAFKTLVDDGALLRIDRSELEPKLPESVHGKNLPVYVVAGLQSSNLDQPDAQVLTTKDNKSYLLVNEKGHVWNEEYVQRRIPTDAVIKDEVRRGSLTTAEGFSQQLGNLKQTSDIRRMRERYGEFISQLSKAAADAQVHPPLQVMIDNTSNQKFAGGNVNSDTSREKTHRLYVDQELLYDALTSDSKMKQLTSMAAHDLTHIVAGDTSPKGIVRRRNAGVFRYEEVQADLKGPAMMGVQYAEALGNWMETQIRGKAPLYLGVSPDSKNLTPADLKAISDRISERHPDHPGYFDRMTALRDEVARMKQYEKTHPLSSGDAASIRAYREAEAKAVVDQVMQDMKGKWTLPMEPPKDAPAKPPAFKASLDNTDHRLDLGEIRTTLAAAIAQPLDRTAAPTGSSLPDKARGRTG